MTLTLGEFILLLAVLCLSAVVAGWLFDNTRITRREIRQKKGVILCRICGVRYEAQPGEVTPCPSCQTPNEIGTPDSI